MVLDDNFGHPDKTNGAIFADRRATGPARETWTHLSFDSPSNAFPGAYYHRAAGLAKATLTLRFAAERWLVRLMCREGNLPPRIVCQENGSGSAELDLDTPALRDWPERFYLDLSYSGQLTVEHLAWTTPAPAALTRLGVAITTYNKPEYLLPNLDTLRQSAAFRAGLLDILVINNGKALEGVPDGIPVTALDNVGGTGGFLEGHRHFRAKGYGHFVIMDDDIAIAPDFVDRLHALSCLSRGCHIGSLAEVLNTPLRVVKEQGADVSEGNVFGLDLNNGNLDLQSWDRHRLYCYKEVDFSGWWSLLVDLAAPVPRMPRKQFIKRDDVMFGYESRVNGVPTVVFPNLLVAHGEEGAPSYYYFDIRNDLILRARNHPPLTTSIRQLVKIAGSLMLTLRLDRQCMFNAALADFMAGPQALDRSDMGRTLKRVRAMAAKPVTLPEDAEVLAGGDLPSSRELLLNWFRPSAWRRGAPPPVVAGNAIRHSMGRYSYYDKLPYGDAGYLRRRSAVSVLHLLRSLALILRFAVTRNALMRAYKKGAVE